MISLRPLSALNLRHSIKRFRNVLAAFAVVGVLAAAFFYVSTRAAGATYYSKGSLAPELVASWSTTRDGLGLPPANFTSGDTFVIQNTHNMGTVAPWTVSGAGSKIQIESGGTLTANNIVAVPTFQVDNGGTYIHNAVSGTGNGTAADIPGSTSRSFGASSNVTIQQWTNGGTTPAALPTVAWGNLTINVATLAGSWNQLGGLNTVNGNLSIQSTGGTTRELRLVANSPATTSLTIGGNLAISGGILNLTSGTAVPTVNLGGNFNQTGGTLTGTGAGIGSINFTGGTSFVGFTQSAGTLTNTNINWSIANGKTVQLNNNFTLPASRSFGINAGGMLLAAATLTNNGAVNVTGEFRLTDGGFATGNNFTYASGTLGFVSSGSYVVNNDAYWPTTNGPSIVTVLGGGMTLNVARTVSGLVQTSAGISNAGNLTIGALCIFQLNTGGYVSGSPTYNAGSLLMYATGGVYARAGEWLPGATSGAGYPADVQLTNNTTLDLPNSGAFNSSSSQMAGSLTIGSGSTLSMGAMTQPLTVLGPISNSGTLTLSTAPGGDIKTRGDFIRFTGATFTHNNRAVYFEGGATQGISDAGGAISIPYVVINKTSGTVKLLATDLTTLAPAGGASINFVGGTSTFTLNGRTLTLGSSIGNTPAGSGFVGDASAKMSLQDGGSAGSMGTLTFVGGSQNLQNLTVNRTSAVGTVILGSNLTVGGTLALTAGQVLTGANTLSLGNAATATRTTGYVLGTLQKSFNAPASFTFHVGTANGYTPVDANSTTGTGSLAVTPVQAKQPNVVGANALSRYWTLAGSGVTSNLTFHYLAGDITGTEANYKIFKYTGGSFTQFTPTTLDTTNHFATLNGVSSFSDWTLAEATTVFGSHQFSASNYNDTETNSGAHNVTVTVQRTGGSSGAVQVHYATSDGTANAGTDYTATSGDLNWVDGDAAARTFDVSVNGDTSVETDETINLTLSAPSGGSALGTPSAATITIQNDDTVANINGAKTVCATGCDYVNLTGASGLFAAINASVVDGNITATISSDLTEDGANALNQWTESGVGNYTLSITPADGATKTISGAVAAGMIRLDGADRVTIDGRFSGAGRFLTFRNTNPSGSTISLSNDASNNSIRSSVIEGAASAPGTNGVVLFGGGPTTGNDDNTVTDNQIRDRSDAAGVPVNLILSSGVAGAAANSNGTISDNELFNFTNRAVNVSGIVANSSESWTVTGNNVYQTAPRTSSLLGISVGAAGSNTITGNTVHDLTSSGTIIRGINLVPTGAGTQTVARNRVYSLTNTRVGDSETSGLVVSPQDTTTVNVVNNMLSVVPASANDQSVLGFYEQGVAGTTVNFSYNTVLVGGTSTGAAPSWACARNTAPTASASTWRDNICFNDRTGGGANHFAAGNQSTLGTFSSDYNVFVGTGATSSDFMDYGTADPGTPVSFAAWQSATGGDANSLAANPGGNYTVANMFTSATDLHLNTAGTNPASNAGTFLPAVTNDYDNDARDTVIPDVGADEVLSPSKLSFTSATYGGGEGDGTITVTVKRADSSVGAVSVNYATSDATAAVGSDYAAASGTLNWAAGDMADKTFDVTVADDAVYEGAETFNVALTSPGGGATLGTPDTATVTITDNDAAPSFSIDDVTHNEGNSGTTSYTFTVTKSGSTTANASVDFATQDGTATIADSDYQSNSGTLTFLPADATKQFTVLVNGDTSVEPNEAFAAVLSNASGATITDASGTGTITNDDVPPPPLTVYVDDDWTGTTPGTDPDGAGAATSFGYDAFATIQGGVTGVASGGTVNVAAGTYMENVIVAKPLTLSGAGEATVTLRPVVANPNCGGAGGGSLCAGSSNLILVQADNVTITGLTLDGDNPSLTSGVVRGGADLDARNGIITNHTAGTYTNLTVHHTTIKNIYLRGVYNSTGGAFNFHHDTVQNVQGEGASIGMFNFGGAGTFDSNTVSDCNDAIASNHSRGTQFTNNTVTTSASGIHTDNAGDGGGTTDTISNNTVTNSQQFGYGVWVFVPSKTVAVQNNTATNVDVGFASAGMAPGIASSAPARLGARASVAESGRRLPASANVNEPESTFRPATNKARTSTLAPPSPPFAAIFTGNTADGQNKANSTGVYLTTDEFGFGTADIRVTFNSNTVVNNTDGFYLEAETTRTLEVAASYNRIVNNTGSAVTTSVAGTLNASMENNWWGCNAGPNNTGCGSIVGGGVDFDPWIVLGVSASPNPIAPGGTSTVTADMRRNSAGADTSAGGFVPAMPVSFSATQGGVSPTSGTITNGQATTTFTSTSTSNGTASATVDNQTTSTNINVTLPSFSIDDVTHNEGDSGTTSYTFTVTKTGTTAFNSTVDYATADGTATSPSDFTAITTTTLTFLPGDASKQFTVLVNGNKAVEPDETFAVNLSNPSGATISDASGTGTITNDDTIPNVVYVDDDWTSTPNGTDPDGAGPAAEMGYDAFATIQGGVNGVAPNGTVNVASGTYDEDVNVNKTVSLLGAGAGTTNVRGPIGGSGTTIQITASNVTVAGFTITRLGNNTTDWNNPGLNLAGVAIQGQTITGSLIRDNVITGNRNGIDINNSNGHTVRNNVIDFNRTGFIYRNQTDYQTVVENFITNNWTVGVLFLDGSGAGVPVQSALNSTFSNNNISANWYGQVVDRQSGGSLPAPGTTNLKNFRGNWWGTTSPVVTTSNSAEPGYAAQIPVAYGGTATPPGGQPDIAGSASANIKYVPVLQSGTDTNVETVPGRGTNGFQGVQPPNVIVRSSNLNGWVIQTDSTATAGFVEGPATPPLGVGSGQLSVGSDGDSGAQFRQSGYNGTLLSSLTRLGYSSYTSNDSTPPAVGDQTVYIILNVDLDGNGTNDTLIFFEPEYQHGYTANVPDQGDNVLNTWQTWDALHGGWWSTTGAAGANPGTDVKTLAQIVAAYPNARLHNSATTGSFRLVAGFGAGSWDNFVGNVDAVKIGVSGANTTYDFEPLPKLSVGDVPHNEGNAGTTSYDFHVTLSTASDQTITVDYATADGTATTADGDYQSNSGTVTFNPGETDKIVTVLVNGDVTYEANEQFFVNLSNVNPNATILDAQGVGTITNDDPAPTLTIDDVTRAEGNGSGTTAFTFTIIKDGATALSASVQYTTADGTAQDGTPAGEDNDYTATSGTLTFAPDETFKTVTVFVKRDNTFEANETFTVVLSNPSNATIFDGTGLGTITNDDAPSGALIVNTTADTDDGSCLPTPSTCTLREAINAANLNADVSSITFQIPATDARHFYYVNDGNPGAVSQFLTATTTATDDTTIANIDPDWPHSWWSIRPTVGGLPNVINPATIDASTQTGASANTSATADNAVLRVELLGTNAGAGNDGLRFVTKNSTARGFAINSFNGDGVVFKEDGDGIEDGDGNAVRGSFIGTDVSGTIDLGNNANGVTTEFDNAAQTSNNNTVGGTTPADRNLISGNNGAGIFMPSSSGNFVRGNIVGLAANGTTALGNTGNGVEVGGSTVGGGDAADGTTDGNVGARNVVSANGGIGVRSISGATSVQGNRIGTDASGTLDRGNAGAGVSTNAGSGMTVGGTAAGAANLVSGNDGDGISIGGGNSNTVQGNLVGTQADGTTALGNTGNGISLASGTTFNTVGGTAAGEANHVAFNAQDGVHVDSTAGNSNTVRGNSIHSNGTTNAHLGIDLGADGVTPNDAQDPDTGPNALQNFPLITNANVTGSTKTISGTLNSTPNQTFEIDFYDNASCDASGNGEGATHVGSVTTALTNASGDVSFTFHPAALSLGQIITATATSTSGSTSEFSPCAVVASGTAGAIQFASANYTVSESGGTASITFTRAGGSDGSITAYFSTSDGTATAPADYGAVASQSVTYADGETGTKSVGVAINQDTLVEGDETVNLSLSSTTINRLKGATRAAAVPGTSATLTIQDDEPPPTLSIGDTYASEPQSGTSNAVFTVTLSAATEIPVSVNYATSDGTATSPADYDANSGTLTFAPGETTKQITVVVKSDALAEGSETFNVTLSNPSAPATIADGSATGTIVDPVLAGQVIVSEFRFRGANGALDEFVELYNNSNNNITVATEDGSGGWALAAIMPDGVTVDLLATIPNGTMIPARTHYLLANAPGAPPASPASQAPGNDLGVASDQDYDSDIGDASGVALFRTANTASFSTATPLDAAGFNSPTTPPPYREGAGLTSPGAIDGQYSFVRKLVTGYPQDTNDNAADFAFVATDGGVYGTVQSTLGAPGPENSGSPLLSTSKIKSTLVDPGCPGTSTTPGDSCARYRNSTPGDANTSAFGTLSLRRTFTNSTSAAVTRLRFRIVDITTRPAPAGTADLRALTSVDFNATKSGGGTAFIRGLTLEEPPTQAIGGGLNSTLAAGTISLGEPLAPSAAINVEFRFGVQQPGSFRAFVIVEALFDGPTTSAPQKIGAAKGGALVKFK